MRQNLKPTKLILGAIATQRVVLHVASSQLTESSVRTFEEVASILMLVTVEAARSGGRGAGVRLQSEKVLSQQRAALVAPWRSSDG